MARPSSIDRQPGQVRESIGAWRQNGKTLDEILDALEAEFGVKLSRSALHRHVQGMEKALASMARSRHIAEAVIAANGHEPESQSARANFNLLQAALTDILLAPDTVDEEGGVLPGGVVSTKQGLELAQALERLSRARKHDVELMGKLREEARKEITAATTTAAREAGVDEAAISAIMSHLNELAHKPGAEA